MLPETLRRLARRFARLPGVGEKTGLRFALYLVEADPTIAHALSEDLLALHSTTGACEQCGFPATKGVDTTICPICSDEKRDGSLLCVVARIQDLLAIERSGAMRGRYVILGRLLSPLEGIGPSDLPLERIRRRVEQEQVAELLLATPPSVDGEATALFLAQELRRPGLRISRIASGVPHGGDIEFADQVTLGRAIDGRQGIGHGPVDEKVGNQ